jgi:hypothetical protein
MRLKEDAECRALRKGKDISCTHCSAQCEVNKLTKLGIIDGFDVAIIPHSSDFSEWLERWKGNKEVGVVGVACVLNLLTGGYETKALGIPAQCVFLDYCGCQKHWDKTGIPTQLNKTQLSTILSYRMEKSVRKELHPVRRRTITTLCCN